MKRIAVETLGCRLNLFESDGILQQFLSSGRYALSDEKPDLVIVNTCTVTDQADHRNRNIIQKTIKNHPGAHVLVTGCYAQTDPEDLKSIPGVFLVAGNDQKSKLFSLYEEKARGDSSPFSVSDPFAYGNVLPQGHTRAYLKIQDGCDRKCTYCKIPAARGRGVSRSLEDILDHARELEEKGIPEIVLTGVNLGWYKDRGVRFGRVVAEILQILRQSRLRLSSIEPCDVDEELGELSLHPRFCDFLHVPLQSGSREILKRMRRTYNPDSFRKRIETVLRINPDLFIGTDVIAGFPGETEADFEESVRVCVDLGMANVHAFPFSPRRGTLAADYADRPDAQVVRRRMDKLKAIKESGYERYAARFVGREREGIVEKEGTEALTDNFLRIRFEDPSILKGSTHNFRIERVEAGQVYSSPL